MNCTSPEDYKVVRAARIALHSKLAANVCTDKDSKLKYKERSYE